VCSVDELGVFRMHNMRTGELLFKRCFGKTMHAYIVVDEINDQVLFVNQSLSGFMIALDSTGRQKWLTQMRGVQLWEPKIHGDAVITLSYNGYLCKLDLKTGAKLACDFLNYRVSSPPAWDGERLAINSLAHGLFMYKV
jgi:hypothetical protein